MRYPYYSKFAQVIVMAVCMTFSMTSQAADLTINPFVKGTMDDLKAQHEGNAFIVVFWSLDCAYCMEELQMFGELQGRYPSVSIITVATDPFLDQETIAQVFQRARFDTATTWVFSDDFVERLYADIDRKWRGELPRTYFYDVNHKNATVAMGMVKKEAAERWLQQQSVDVP